MGQRVILGVAAVAVVAAAAAAMVEMRKRSAATEADTAATPAASADIDPDAIGTLTRMGAYLRSLTAFQVRASTSHENVLESGQKVQFDRTVDILAQRHPDRLREDVTSDKQHRLLLYNGKLFTMWADRSNYYTTVPAPPTIGELVDTLENKFGIETVLGDLFLWGTPRSQTSTITSALDIGPSTVDGTTCEQYAFRQPGLDWQLWVQQGNYPLPRKLVITTLTDDARPQYEATLTWNLAPSYNDAAFTFDPPPDAHKITLAQIRDSTVKVKQ